MKTKAVISLVILAIGLFISVVVLTNDRFKTEMISDIILPIIIVVLLLLICAILLLYFFKKNSDSKH